MCSAVKRAVERETDDSVLWQLRAALLTLECRDLDLVPPLLGKLKSDNEELVLAAAAILRDITGVKNGPYSEEDDEERVEDVQAWQAWWAARKQ